MTITALYRSRMSGTKWIIIIRFIWQIGSWRAWWPEIVSSCTCGQFLTKLLSCQVSTFCHISENAGGTTSSSMCYGQTHRPSSQAFGCSASGTCRHTISLADSNMISNGTAMSETTISSTLLRLRMDHLRSQRGAMSQSKASQDPSGNG